MRVEFERVKIPLQCKGGVVGSTDRWVAEGPLEPGGGLPVVLQDAYKRGEIEAWLKARPASITRAGIELFGDGLWRAMWFAGRL